MHIPLCHIPFFRWCPAELFQGILGLPVTEEQELRAMNLEQLEAMTGELQSKLRSR